MPMVLAFVVLVLQAFLSAGHYPGHSYYRGLSSIPRECQGRFPQLTNYTYDGSELTVITVYPWNFNQVEAANLSGEIHTAFQGDLLMNPNDYGQLVHLDFHGSLDFEAICSFPSSGGKRSFECTSENMSYIMEFRIRDFQPKRCVARSLEIVGVRGTPDNNMSVQDALVNYPSPVLSFPRKRSSLACLANAVSGSEGSNGSNGYHNYHPSGPSSPKSYGYDIYDRYGRKRYGNWKKWNKNWWRASGRGNLVEEASDVSTNVSTCGTPRLNGVILEIVGTVAAIDGPVNVAGKATFLQFDELGQLSSSGKFVQAKMELSQIGRTRLAQRQLFMCVLREQESEGSMLCNNQFLNLLGGAVFIGVTPANACVPAKLQFFAQYRFLQETTYGPAYGESLDFPGLTDCNGGFPKVLNVECNFTADGGTELGYLVTQEFLRLEFQGDFNGTASENGRFVRTSSYANESTYCAWERGNTLSCIFGQTCIVLRGSVAADSQCSAVEYNFLGASGGWCAGQRVQDAFGNFTYRFFAEPPHPYQWTGSCSLSSKSKFEAYNCNCAFDTALGMTRNCAFIFVSEALYREEGLQDCRDRMGLTDPECESFVSSLITINLAATIFAVLPWSLTCQTYQAQLATASSPSA